MGMRINGVRNPYEVYQSQKTGNVSRLSRAEEKKDMVALSTQAKDYQVAAKAVREAPDIRLDKVAELQAKFDSGDYNVSTMDIVDKMLGSI